MTKEKTTVKASKKPTNKKKTEKKATAEDILNKVLVNQEDKQHFLAIYEVYLTLHKSLNDPENPLPKPLQEDELLRTIEIFFAHTKLNEVLVGELFNMTKYVSSIENASLLDRAIGATFLNYCHSFWEKFQLCNTTEEFHRLFKPKGSGLKVTDKDIYKEEISNITPLSYNPQDIVADLHHWTAIDFEEGIQQNIIIRENNGNRIERFTRKRIWIRSMTAGDLKILADKKVNLEHCGDEANTNLANSSAIFRDSSVREIYKLFQRETTNALTEPLCVFEDGMPVDEGNLATLEVQETTLFFFLLSENCRGKISSLLNQKVKEMLS